MTKEQATQKGLIFTGHYGRNKAEVQMECDKIQKQGYKVSIVTVPDSPLSRGYVGKGWSLYAEVKYGNDLKAADLKARIAKHPEILAYLKTEYDKQVVKANEDNEIRTKWLLEHAYI